MVLKKCKKKKKEQKKKKIKQVFHTVQDVLTIFIDSEIYHLPCILM